MAKFRFQDLEIWKMAIELGDKLFDIADMLEQKRLYRRKLIDEKTQNELLEAFDHLSRRITSFKQTLKID